jgi:hypothetical protein
MFIDDIFKDCISSKSSSSSGASGPSLKWTFLRNFLVEPELLEPTESENKGAVNGEEVKGPLAH